MLNPTVPYASSCNMPALREALGVVISTLHKSEA